MASRADEGSHGAGTPPPPPPLDSTEAVKLWLSERFAHETDPNVILRVVAETLGRYLGVSRVGYGEVVPGDDWITIPLDWTDGVATMVGRRPLHRRSTLVPEYERGRTLVVRDTEAIQVTPEERLSLRETRCRAFIAVPLIHDGRFVALFAANHHEVRDWTAEEVLLVQQTGARTWSALQHARTIARLRESEDEFRMLAENMPGICWLAGPDGRATWMNRKGLDFYGPLDGALNAPGAALHPDDRAEAWRSWREAQEKVHAVEVRVRLRGQDGRYRRFLARAAPVLDKSGAVARWCGIQFDRTDQDARERHDAFFRALSDAIRTETDAGAILDTVAAMLRGHLGIDRVLYADAADRADGIALSINRGPEPGAAIGSAIGTYPLGAGFDPLLAAWRRGEVAWSEDVSVPSAVNTPEVREVMLRRGVRSAVDAPLVKDGRLVAVLMAHHGEPRSWSAEERALVEDVAERTWSTVTRARAEAALRTRERDQAFLIGWNDRIRGEHDPDRILDATLEMLGRHYRATRATFSQADTATHVVTFTHDWTDGLDSVVGLVLPLDELGPEVAAYTMAARDIRIADVASDPDLPDVARRLYAATGTAAIVAAPLRRDDAVPATISVQQDRPRAWTDAEVQLLRDVAERTWTVLERARAEAEVKARQRDQAFLIEWSDGVRAETDPDAILSLTLARLGEHLGASRATYSTIGIDDGYYSIVAEWGPGEPPVLGYSFPASNLSDTVRAAYLAGELLVSGDMERDARFSPEARRRFVENRVRARLGIPLARDGTVHAILAIDQNAPRAWRPDDVRLAGEVADRMWVLLERARAEQALKERERDRAVLLDWSDRTRGQGAPDALLDMTLERLGRHLGVARATYSESDASGRLFTVLAEWRRSDMPALADTSFSLDEVGATVEREWSAGEVVRYDDVAADPRVEPQIAPAYREAGIAAFVSIPLIQDGKVRSALSVQSAVPHRWRDGEVELLRDFAERLWIALGRARATAEVRRRERDRAFLLDWSDRLSTEADPARIAEVTLERLGTHLGTARANLAEGAVDEGRFRVVAEWRADGAAGGGPRHAVSGGVHQDYLDGDVVVVEDARADSRFEPATAQAYAAVDAVAFLGVPMLRGGRVQAVLSVQQGSPRPWAPAEVQLLRDVANRFWVLLDRARAQEELRGREREHAFLLEWSDGVRGESSPRAILAETLKRLGRYLDCSRANYGEVTPDGDALISLQEWTQGTVAMVGRVLPFSVLGERVIADHRTGRPMAVDDVFDHPLFADVLPTYAAADVRAVLSVPLVVDGQLMAVLSAQHAGPHRWTGSEVRLMREVADRTWAVLARAHSEARLADSEAQLAAFMENAPVAMHLADADGRYVRVNPEFAAAVRRPRESLPGLKAEDLFPAGVAAAMTAMAADALASGNATQELEPGGAEGAYRSIQSIIFPVTSSGPARTGGFTLDLTGRKEAEDALRRSREALYQTEKLSALGSLLAGVSHELNNPLSIVVAQAVMMERQSKGTDLADRAFKIRRAADRCARIVQTFLAMARQKRPERQPTDLNRVAAAAMELAQYGLRTDGVAAEQRFDESLPQIAADGDQLHQIIVNLVINAQHAMAGREGERRVTVSTARGPDPQTVVLEVADTGPGVPEEARRRIFEPFYTTKPQGEGTGVGLSFSQGLAEAHGGRLTLLPAAAGEGATFRLTLPIEEELTPPGTEPAALPGTGARRRALVIDDEAEIAESLAEFLGLEGYACEVAIGGAAAKARLARGDWDLIVSDLRMPDVDGPALHAFVVAERPELAPRMAFTTGDTLGAAAARFLAETDRPVLEKPFMPDAVRRFLEQIRAS